MLKHNPENHGGLHQDKLWTAHPWGWLDELLTGSSFEKWVSDFGAGEHKAVQAESF